MFLLGPLAPVPIPRLPVAEAESVIRGPFASLKLLAVPAINMIAPLLDLVGMFLRLGGPPFNLDPVTKNFFDSIDLLGNLIGHCAFGKTDQPLAPLHQGLHGGIGQGCLTSEPLGQI
jgi:hypothetical protein